MKRVVIVNKKDEVIGSEGLVTALKNGDIRRISRILVFNSKGEMFLQRRPKAKIIAPDCWDQSAGGHVDIGESYEQAAYRELDEELGVSGVKLTKIAYFYLEEPYKGGVARQFNSLYKTTYDGKINTDKEELAGGRWVTLSEVNKMIKEKPSDFAPGIKKCLEVFR